MVERVRVAPTRHGEPYVPLRCHRSPNATLDRAFGIFVCHQRDARCAFHGPVFVLDDDGGRQYECQKRER